MKKSLPAILLLAALAAACGQKTQSNANNSNTEAPFTQKTPTTEKMAADQAAENARNYAKLWEDIINKGQTQLLDTKFAENVVLKTPSAEIKGREEVKKYWLTILKAFSKPEFRVDEVFGKDDRVVKRWTFTGDNTGDFGAIKATNRKITFTGITIAKIVDGLVVEEIDYSDDLGLMQQLGAIPGEEK